jgi:formate--tetrahydrofolate ligase
MAKVKSDIEIAREADMKPIKEIAAKIGIKESDLIPYGHTKAKLSADFIKSIQSNKDGNLILVTAINPTLPAKARQRPRLALVTA